MTDRNIICPLIKGGMNRRRFLARTGGATMTIMLAGIPGFAGASELPAWITDYERVRVARISEIVRHSTIYFEYPDQNSSCFMVQMDGEAGAGVGPDKDIVAFHTNCTHMGAPLNGTYKKEHAAMGPCPSHLTTFDLRRHGMVIAGHATESLPQVILEEEDGWIYANGMMGLIFGRIANIPG
jgi:arsenite oxidase small subunit